MKTNHKNTVRNVSKQTNNKNKATSGASATAYVTNASVLSHGVSCQDRVFARGYSRTDAPAQL